MKGLETVRLKNGADELPLIVQTSLSILHEILRVNPLAFYELLMKCRYPAYEFSRRSVNFLTATFPNALLIDDARNITNISIQNVLISSIPEGAPIVFSNPILVATEEPAPSRPQQGEKDDVS